MSDAEYESVCNKKFRLKWSGDSLSHYCAKLFMPRIIKVTATSVNCFYRQKCKSLSSNVTSGALFEGDLGEILTLGSEILPYISGGRSGSLPKKNFFFSF